MQNTATYIGVFSRRERTAKGMVAKKMYFVWESQNAYLVQELDRAYQPTGNSVPVDKKNFIRNFVQEKQIHAQSVAAILAKKTPQTSEERKAEQQTENAARPRTGLPAVGKLKGLGEFGELPDAEDTAAAEDENGAQASQQSALRELELRESFRKAILRLKRPRDRDAALETLQNLSDIEEGIEQTHKHMFADFGISLRQNTLLELALHCCQRVLELAPDDDHAHFNAARILFEMNRCDESKKHLMRAIELDADEPIYERMLRHVEKTQVIAAKGKTMQTATLTKNAREPVPTK